MDVAPRPSGALRFNFVVAQDRRTALIDEIHSAEVADLVVDHREFAMVAAIKPAEELALPKHGAEAVVTVHENAGLAQVVKERIRRGNTADRIVEQPTLDPRRGAALQCIDQARHGIIRRDRVGLDPHAPLRRANVGRERGDHLGRFGKKLQPIPRDVDRRRIGVARERRQARGAHGGGPISRD